MVLQLQPVGKGIGACTSQSRVVPPKGCAVSHRLLIPLAASANIEPSTVVAPATGVASSGCPFIHQAGLDSLASATSNILQATQQKGSNPASKSNGKSIKAASLSSGPGWTALAADAGDDLPKVEGRFCWNPVVGEALELESKGTGPFLLERYREFGPVFSWQMGGQQVVSVLNYETIKSLLANDGKVVRGWNPETLYAMLGETTRANLENPEMRMSVRKILAPGFTPHALDSYTEKMVNIVSTQLDEWVEAGSIDLTHEGKTLSFEFSTQLLVDFAVPQDQKQDLRRKFNDLFIGMMSPAIKLPGTRFSRGIHARQELIDDLKVLLKEKKQGPSSNGAANGTGKKFASVWDYMLEARKLLLGAEELSDEDVAQSGIGMVIAGNDTSGLGITGILGLLPLMPEVMQLVREEQDEIVAKYGPNFTRSVLDQMPYTDAVIKEALRFTPPATFAFRKTMVDMEIEGKFVPAGSVLHLSFFIAQLLTDPNLSAAAKTPAAIEALAQQKVGLNELPAHYFRLIASEILQESFKPERWLASSSNGSSKANGGSSNSSSSSDSQLAAVADGLASASALACPVAKPSGLLTFGSGPHICLGQSLFMMEAKILVALLARHYTLELETPDEFGFKMGFVPEPTKACMLRVGKRM